MQQELHHAWKRAGSALARDKSVSEQEESDADKTYDIANCELELDFLRAHRLVIGQAANALTQHALHIDARTRATKDEPNELRPSVFVQRQLAR